MNIKTDPPNATRRYLFDSTGSNGVTSMEHGMCFGCGRKFSRQEGDDCVKSLSALSYVNEYCPHQEPSPPVRYLTYQFEKEDMAGIKAGCSPESDHIWVCWECAH